MPTPTKGPRLGGGPAHERLMLANLTTALFVNGRIVYSPAYPRTRALLERRGAAVIPVGLGELAKAEGALTCCSLIFRGDLVGG